MKKHKHTNEVRNNDKIISLLEDLNSTLDLYHDQDYESDKNSQQK